MKNGIKTTVSKKTIGSLSFGALAAAYAASRVLSEGLPGAIVATVGTGTIASGLMYAGCKVAEGVQAAGSSVVDFVNKKRKREEPLETPKNEADLAKQAELDRQAADEAELAEQAVILKKLEDEDKAEVEEFEAEFEAQVLAQDDADRQIQAEAEAEIAQVINDSKSQPKSKPFTTRRDTSSMSYAVSVLRGNLPESLDKPSEDTPLDKRRKLIFHS